MLVNELYGPVFQGEGRHLGQPSFFLRLGGCNLACTWCDTPYTWDASRFDLQEENHKISAFSVAGKLGLDMTNFLMQSTGKWDNMGLIISGGEPMLQQPELQAMFEYLETSQHYWVNSALGLMVTIETAGTIPLLALDSAYVNTFSVSPKLSHSGNIEEKRYKPEVLKQLNRTRKAVFKFVCAEPDDLLEVDQIVEDVGISADKIYIMPEGIDAESVIEHTRALEEAVLKRQWNMTTRLHILMHGNERGR